MFKKFIVYLIKGYQLLVSPHLVAIVGVHGCKFKPTCSEMTILSVEKYGVIKGLILGFNRLRKCW